MARTASGLRNSVPVEFRSGFKCKNVEALGTSASTLLQRRFHAFFLARDKFVLSDEARAGVPAQERIVISRGPDGLLVGVQNGMTVDTIAQVVGSSRTLGCVIEITSAMFEPGVVERHSPPDRSWFAVGSLGPDTRGREEEIAALLRHVGAVEIVDDIRAAKWMKIVSNATTLVTTAIIGLSMVEAAADPRMRAFMLRSGQEALDATVGLGNPVLPIFGLTEEALGRPENRVEVLLDTLLGGFVMPDSKTTILQDWMKGRRSEVDDINGLVARTHRRLGGRAPANEAVVEVAHRIENHELKPGVENLDLLLELERTEQPILVRKAP